MKNFKKHIITTKPLVTELTSGLLWQLDIEGINETDDGLIVFTEESKKIHISDIEKILLEMLNQNLIEDFQIEEEILEDKNWNEEYEKNVRVIEVSDRLVLKPSFKNYKPKPNQIIITIDPKMSFGTGEHATTKLALRFIEKYLKGNEKVLDVGSGSGVLAISSVMLGASSALGIDNDEWCLLNGNENVKANNLEGKVEIRLVEIQQIEEKDFDLVVANINKHILLEIGRFIRQKIKETGILILSGLLTIDENDIVKSYSEVGFESIDRSETDEWIAIAFKIKPNYG